MTYFSNSPDRSTSTVRADVMKWPQLWPSGQPMPDEQSSRFFVLAVFVSMAIHAFLVYLLCVIVADRTTVVGPTARSIGTAIIVSLVSLPTSTTAPHDGLDSEAVSDLFAQYAQSPPERSRSTERKSEGESVVISKGQGIPGAKAPLGESPAADATSSIKLEVADHTTVETIRIPEFEAGLVLTSKGQSGMGPEVPDGEFFATGTTPSIDIEAYIAGEIGRLSMTEFELQGLSFKSIELYQKNHPDGPSFAGGGLIAVPFFLMDVITGNGYKWFMQEEQERQQDQERLEFMSNLMTDSAFDSP